MGMRENRLSPVECELEVVCARRRRAVSGLLSDEVAEDESRF
jgi:hypothetical protein